MKIIEALKDENTFDIRVSHANKWMVYDSGVGFSVYEHKYRAKINPVLIQTFNEEKAIEMLLKE